MKVSKKLINWRSCWAASKRDNSITCSWVEIINDGCKRLIVLTVSCNNLRYKFCERESTLSRLVVVVVKGREKVNHLRSRTRKKGMVLYICARTYCATLVEYVHTVLH
jgi:hypothetical protein